MKGNSFRSFIYFRLKRRHAIATLCLKMYNVGSNFIQKNKTIGAVLGLAVVGLISLNSILSYFTQYFNKTAVYTGDAESISFITWSIPIISFAYCWMCFKINKVHIQGINQILFWMVLLEIILVTYNYIGTSFSAFYRLSFYFALGKIFLISNATSLIKDNELRRLTIICLCICWIAYMTMTFPYGYEYIIL